MDRIKLLIYSILTTLSISCAKPLEWADPNQPENSPDMVTVLFCARESSGSKVTGVTDESERTIGRWAVFAFDDQSNWVRYATSESGDDIPMNLRAGRQYSCYAVVNYSTTGTGALIPSTITAKSQLENKVAYLGDNATGFLMMFGSHTLTPTTGSQECSIQVKRIVSRINITGIGIDFSDKPYLAEKTFILQHVYVTNAYRTTLYGDDYAMADLSSARTAWYNSGGWHRGESAEAAMDALLAQRGINTVITAEAPYAVPLTFYAFPNPTTIQEDNHQMDVWTPRCTRLVIEATLGGETMYYQVNVPDMERNHVYSATNIVIRGRGSSDPEIIDIDPSVLDITFDMDDGWDGTGSELNLTSAARLRPVTVKLDSGHKDTKSVISVESEDFKCAYLFAFDAHSQRVFLDEEGRNIAIRTASRTINWAIPVGPDGAGNSQVMDVYAVVNPDRTNAAILEELLSRADVTEDEMEDLLYVCDDALALSSVETDGMPMSACRKNLTLESAEASFTLSLKRLFSRYDLGINITPFSQGGWTVETAEVLASHSNTRVPFFFTGQGVGVQADAKDLAMVDMATDSDLENLNTMGEDGKSAGSLTLYFLENCQGDIGPASAWNKVYAELGDDVSCCSYAEFIIKATNPTLGERCFKYRFYPGQADDMCSNFDIVRNVHKKVNLSLSPDLSSEYFRWVFDGSLRVAPGEMLTVRYETTLEENLLCFGTFLDGLSSDYLEVEHTQSGMVTVKARPDAPEDGVFLLQGGDASGQISDKVPVLVTSAASFWKDVNVLYTPEYRGQWMVVQLPENVFGTGDYLQAQVRNDYLDNSGNYVSGSSLSQTITQGQEVFGNGKTGIYHPHIWFSPDDRRLFVYSHNPRPHRDNYSTLTLSVITGEGASAYPLHRKEYVFRQKEPVLRLVNSLSSTQYRYDTTIDIYNHIKADELSFVLVDPDNNNHIIPNSEFRWGGHGIYAMPGMTFAPYKTTSAGFYCDNFIIESQIEDDYEDSSVVDYFDLDCPVAPDEGSWDFNYYNLYLKPTSQADYAYGEDRYYRFSHTFFQKDEVHIHPTCRVLETPEKSLTLMQALSGTNDYDAMKCSSQKAGEDFYLMYGFRQTFFVKLENIPDNSPVISLDGGSALEYSITRVQPRLYRLDLWLNRYDNPLSHNDLALPYVPTQSAADPSDGDYDVDITVSSGGYQADIVCHVLHKRFGAILSDAGRRDLKLQMWNPLGFNLEASCTLYADYKRYWYKHPLKEIINGPSFDTQSTSITLKTNLSSSSLVGEDISARLEKASRDLKGIHCTYARDLHPAFIECSLQREDLILYYPPAEATSFSGSLSLSSNGFVSSVAGLSLKDNVFNLDHYIAFLESYVHINYTLSTLSEYYLQTLFYQTTDIWYYDYRFATPLHWVDYNEGILPSITSDEPLHIGGPDVTRTVSGNIGYRGNRTFHADDPAIGN